MVIALNVSSFVDRIDEAALVETRTCNSPANNACPPTVPLSMMMYSTSSPCFWNVLVSRVAHTAALLAAKPAVAMRIFSAAMTWERGDASKITPTRQLLEKNRSTLFIVYSPRSCAPLLGFRIPGSACLRIKLIDRPALINLTDKAHINESLGIGGLGAGVPRGGEVEDCLHGSGRHVRSARELLHDERFVGVFQSFAILNAEVLLHDLQGCFPIRFGVMNRFHDDANDAPDRVLIRPDVSPPGHQPALQERNAQLYTVRHNPEP